MKYCFLISDISHFGFLIAYCIEHDISVFRCYWDNRVKGKRCYLLDPIAKRLSYASLDFCFSEGYDVISPLFYFNNFGNSCLDLSKSSGF